MNVLLLLILFTVRSVRSIILIPEEVPSLLSIVYSNIPPVLKGTDSRLGIGFRLGPNADFQYQIELGPQTRTQQIGPDAPAPEASKKRHVQQQNQLGNLPSKDKPHWIYTWNNINPGSTGNKDTLPKDFDFDQPQQAEGDMVNQVNYGGAQYQNNGVASHLYKLYEQSTLNKQKTISTTAAPDKQEDSVIVSNIDKQSHSLAPPKDRISQASESKKQSISNNSQRNVDKALSPVNLSTTHPHVHNSHVNKAPLIPLEKPKQVNQSSKPESEIEDQEIEASENHDIVSEAETENRINQIHSLTHSQFVQRVPANQKKDN
uniref:Uncharacterized protein n=1 Tax=Cacopsylla melanoneura TaxID=428564 RepID=A0A8D9F077_9HEMI